MRKKKNLKQLDYLLLNLKDYAAEPNVPDYSEEYPPPMEWEQGEVQLLLDYINDLQVQLQQKENETKNAKNKTEHYKDVLRQIIHYCNYLRNDHKYSLNDGHIRKIKKICEREVGADDKI